MLGTRAQTLGYLGQIDRAMTDLDRALRIVEAALGPDHTDVAEILVARANVTYEAGDLAGSIADLERARAIVATNPGPDPGLAAHIEEALDFARNNQ